MSGDGEPLNIPPLRSCNPVLQPDSQKQELPARSRTDSDATYFKCYDNVGVHEEMLKDRVQTETYKAAVSRYQDAIAGKVVLDVGCGTGILAIFCALAGASQVYAVDESEIAFQAAEIVRANNLSDKVIVLHGRIEDILITQKVDVIISEWMGYMLLHESMLSSIIFARNKWLKRGGLILPSHAKLFMAPFTHSGRYSESIDFWKNVYGINMSSLMPLAKQCAFVDPLDERISGNNILSSPILVMEVDCYTVMVQELECVTAEFRFISTSKAPLNGFAFWFNVTFNGLKSRLPIGNPVSLQSKSDEAIVLSTAPYDAPTHWKQTLVYLYNPIELEQDQIIEGSVTLAQNKSNPRTLNIRITFTTGNQSFVKETVLRRLT